MNRLSRRFKLIFSLIFVLVIINCQPPVNHYENAKKEWLNNDFLGAIIELNCLLNNDFRNDSAFVLRAKCYSKILKHEKVLNDLRKALDININNTEARLELSKYYVSKSDTSRANKMLDSLISLKGKYVSEAWIEKGKINYFNDKFALSILNFDKAIKADSTNYLAWYYRAIMRSTFFDKKFQTNNYSFFLLDFDKAIVDFKKSTSLKPDFADAWYRLGLVYLNKFDSTNGIKAINLSISLEPQNPYYYLGRADYCFRQLKYERAIEDYSKSIRISQIDPNAFEGRANCYKAIEKIELFKEDYKKAYLLRKDFKKQKVM
jgi:tetratricopeptide (TPR) repeat protein